jgi:lipoprotein-releasing system permease protein
MMSIVVISLVVWLVLVFLSVTGGMERTWLQKLTSLNAPLRITPTEAYYASYYYQIDALSEASHYSHKTIGEKACAPLSDPYSPERDLETPPDMPAPDLSKEGSLRDPVQRAFQLLSHFRSQHPGLAFQDYELSGALMRLQLLRTKDQDQSFLTQASYLSSFSDESPYLHSLILEPTITDLNHLLQLLRQHPEEGLHSLFNHVTIEELSSPTPHLWRFPSSLLPAKRTFAASLFIKQGAIDRIHLSPEGKGTLERKQDGSFLFTDREKREYQISGALPLFVEGGMHLHATLIPDSLKGARTLEELRIHVSSSLQEEPISGEIFWNDLEISRATIQTAFEEEPSSPPYWVYSVKGKKILPTHFDRTPALLLPKNLRDHNIQIGDSGHLSYQAATASSLQEQRLPFYVAGFYDPGIMSVGNKCVLAPRSVLRTINTSSHSYAFDRTLSNGISVWLKDLKQVQSLKAELSRAFESAGIAPYWKITTYHEYDFTQDLLQQFASDKYLFTLIAGIILTVACCNIISLLTLLVNDKKREIGILRALGASSKSIAAIFGICGMALGTLSSLIGIGAALLTLHNIHHVVGFLSFLQGHEAFNSAFYGSGLPRELSHHALLFILIATPLLSLAAGLVPAIKASRLHASSLLRSE